MGPGSVLLRRLATAAVPRTPCSGVRHASTGRRDFFQRINEQYLAHEIANLSGPAHGLGAPERGLFDPKIRPRPVPRVTPVPAETQASSFQDGAEDGEAGVFKSRRRAKPWLHYESLRGDTYPSGNGGKGPRWQDLTHSEAQRMQEMYMRKRMVDRKILWLKMQQLPNPQKEAKMTLRRQQQAEKDAQDENSGVKMYPPPFMDVQPEAKRLQRMEDAARQEELESRFRARIREEKLENARIVKANMPLVGGVVTDPIKRHVHRRLVRQRVKIHAGLEEVLTRNTAQILYEFLRGVAISIVKVQAKRPRQTQEIHYNLTSDHDPAWVQKQLEVLAPKLRSQLAINVNLGQTPNIRFVPHVPAREIRRAYLWQFARKIKEEVPTGGGAVSGAA